MGGELQPSETPESILADAAIVSAEDIELMNTYGDTIDPKNYTNSAFARVYSNEENASDGFWDN